MVGVVVGLVYLGGVGFGLLVLISVRIIGHKGDGVDTSDSNSTYDCALLIGGFMLVVCLFVLLVGGLLGLVASFGLVALGSGFI